MSIFTKTLRPSNDGGNEKRTGFFTSINTWIKVGGISRSLYQLDDRTLDDLGISRAEIPTYARKLATQDNQSAA